MGYYIKYGWYNSKKKLMDSETQACFGSSDEKYHIRSNDLTQFYIGFCSCKNTDKFIEFVKQYFKSIKIEYETEIKIKYIREWGMERPTEEKTEFTIIKIDIPNTFSELSRFTISLILGHIFRSCSTGEIYLSSIERLNYHNIFSQNGGGHSWVESPFKEKWLSLFDDYALMNGIITKDLEYDSFYGRTRNLDYDCPFFCSKIITAILNQIPKGLK